MGPDQLGIFWLIISSVALLATLFGMRYLRNKENMALIEKGINPNVTDNRPAPYRSLKNGLLFVGAGIGLLAAFIIDLNIRTSRHDQNPAIYFALIAIGGGLGLIISYAIEKKEWLNRKNDLS